MSGDRGFWLKSKSFARLPRIGALSRTSGRGSGRPSVARVEPPAAEEVVLDELRVGVEAQRLVIDVAALRVRADHDPRYAQAVTVHVDPRRHDVVVETAPVVPGRGRSRSSSSPDCA